MIRPTLALATLCTFLVLAPSAAAADCRGVSWTPHWSRVESARDLVRTNHTVDFNGDGVLDLVGTIAIGTNHVLHSWRGLGNATFAVPAPLGEQNITALAAGDLNQDGRKDLAFLQRNTNDELVVRLAAGNGFGPKIFLPLDYHPEQITLGHFDSDGNLDVVVAPSQTGGGFVTYYGNGTGALKEGKRVGDGWATDLVMADLDNDGRTDVAYGAMFDGRVEVRFQNADGSFEPPLHLPVTKTARDLEAADLDHDGRIDLVSVQAEARLGPIAPITVHRNAGSRRFVSTSFGPAIPTAASNYSFVRVVDLNADGNLDLLAATVNFGYLLSYIGTGDGTFLSPTYYRDEVGPTIESLAIGDFDADGDFDAAAGAFRELVVAKSYCGTGVRLLSRTPAITAGAATQLRAIVSGFAPGKPALPGRVLFMRDSSVLGYATPDANGQARLDAGGLPAGEHTITAQFFVDGQLPGGYSNSIVQKVLTYATTTTISGPDRGAAGEELTFTTQTRRGDTGQLVTTGWLAVSVDGQESTVPVSTPLKLKLGPGRHTIEVQYFDASLPASAPVTKTVTMPSVRRRAAAP